jgi:hypothetical protein
MKILRMNSLTLSFIIKMFSKLLHRRKRVKRRSASKWKNKQERKKKRNRERRKKMLARSLSNCM